MSDIVEKTISSLPSLISGTLTGKNGSSSSRGFQSFVKNLGNIKSRYEEEIFLKRELCLQKQRLGQPGVSLAQTREGLVRLVYCSMLGQDVSFAYIHAIKLAQQGALFDKRAGYLVAAMFLKDSDELVMLLVNTIQKDLRSTNVACMTMALTAASRLISQEMVPALLPFVEQKLTHPREVVRKKAVLCMLAFHGKARDLLAHGHHHLGAALCDPDPGVMWAALHYYHELIKAEPSAHTSLVPTLLGLLEQVLNRRLSSDFEYHSVPAPWLQILLLKMLAKLGEKNESSSQLMYPILGDILQRTEPSHKIGLAVIYECVVTILSIWPQPALVEHAAKVVGKFLSSKNNNLRYLGIRALTMVVRIHPGYAVEHQEAVVDCLEHCDLTIRTQTLDLLYQMANPQNRHVITERLLNHLSMAPDQAARAAVLNKVLALADRFAKDRRWYMETVNRAVLLGGEAALPAGVAERIITIIPERGDQTAEGRTVHQVAVEAFWTLLHQDEVPWVLLQVAAWVMGELCVVVGDLDLGRVVTQLTSVYFRPAATDYCRAAILSALFKLSCDIEIPAESLTRFSQSIRPQQTELRQRFLELERMSRLRSDGQVLKTLNGIVKETAEEQQDWCLSFLDDFVAERLEAGGLPYRPSYIRQPPAVDANKESNSLFVGLNFTPYENVAAPSTGRSLTPVYTPGDRRSVAGSDGLSHVTDSTLTNIQLSAARRVWTKDGVVSLPEPMQPSPPPNVTDLSPTTHALSDQAVGTEPPASADVDARRQQIAELFSGISDKNLQPHPTAPSQPGHAR